MTRLLHEIMRVAGASLLLAACQADGDEAATEDAASAASATSDAATADAAAADAATMDAATSDVDEALTTETAAPAATESTPYP